MENEYNDYQILNPVQMEQIARAYLKEFENINKNTLPNDWLECLNATYNCIKQLKSVCNKRFYDHKQTQIKNIINRLEKIYKNLNIEIKNQTNSNFNYCELIQKAIYNCGKLIYICPNVEIENLAQIVQQLPYLLGTCKYRKPF